MPDNKADRAASAGIERSSTDGLEDIASRLARHHTVSHRPQPGSSPLERLRVQERLLRQVYDRFVQVSETQGILSGAAEWLLDNFYVVRQAARQIREDMPKSYYQRLPKLEGPALAGYPRIYALALEMIKHDAGLLDLDRVTRFIRAYQQVTPLTMGELWALPTMLRLGVLELLTLTVADTAEREGSGDSTEPEARLVADGQRPSFDQGAEGLRQAVTGLAEEAIVANCIISLRTLANEDWKAFFESVSRVEQGLRSEPGAIYARMDFRTRDRYRKIVEELALATGRTEERVAHEAVDLASEHLASPTESTLQDLPRDAHVGFYLVDRGRAELEARLGYRPSWGARLRRWLLDHAPLAHLCSVGTLTLIALLGAIGYGATTGGTPVQLVAVALLALLPATDLAVNLINWLVTRTVPPRMLPKLDFSQDIPAGCRTMAVVPALLTNPKEVAFLLQQMELHYLGNADPHLHFALLTDFSDAPHRHMPEDAALLDQARSGIRDLNREYAQAGRGPFFLFHRERQWNPAEDCWMGWERKRGKLTEFNRLLGGSTRTSFTTQVGDLGVLAKIRYVITLDADTVLPRESARRLVATLAHPLNRAEFDAESDRVVAGYTVLQPRTEVKPDSANQSWLTRIFAGDAGLDLYTRAVSDVYQDLFGEGIYVGKGIYDVTAFERSVAGRVPENALLSHDLFEGVQGRAALVTDVVLFESYPPGYLTYAHRLHRWVRGDWQLVPWLLPRVPHAGAGTMPNDLSAVDRWKIVDNLRRSVRVPALLALLIAGWLWLPGSALAWTLVALATSAAPLVTGIATGLAQRLQDPRLGGTGPALRVELARWALALVFLPYEALLMVDAIGTTLVRLTISHKRLLQWTTAAHTIRLFGRETRLTLVWKQMGGAPAIAAGLAALIGLSNPSALPAAAPLLLAWLASPLVALWISKPIAPKQHPLSTGQRQQLRWIARRTWLYFERLVGPDDHWLPPDHFQEHPRGIVAHRTSPTNLGLLLLSTLAAYDLGYIGPMNLILRLRATLETTQRLERHRGHFMNWYDTRTLKPLLPRYVSTVDSGNLAGCLLALRQGLQALPGEPLPRWQRWQGLLDTLGVLTEIVDGIEPDDFEDAVTSLEDHVADMCRRVSAARENPERWAAVSTQLSGEAREELDLRLGRLVEAGSQALDSATLRDLRLWSERVHHHLYNMQDELHRLVPWLESLNHPPALFNQAEQDAQLQEAWLGLRDALPSASRLGNIPALCKEGQTRLGHVQARLVDLGNSAHSQAQGGRLEQLEEAHDWCERLSRDLYTARMTVESLMIGTRDLSEQAEAYFQAMDFSFLFDPQRQVFHLGYDAAAERLSDNYYDLLASEARIASLVAIAKGDVPQSHWLHLDRPLARVDGMRMLLSWNGSMFEYLMPRLLMRTTEGTLLDQTDQAVVRRQIAYARQKKVPWGISESGYYQFDANQNYQYRGFGVPEVGRKRGLGEDLVIAPYASLLALPLDPEAVGRNVDRLIKQQVLGQYGFYEAIDYTHSRLPLGQERAIVQSYMAHHQGMILVALANFLADGAAVRRFHADPRVRSVELLLQEQVPQRAPVEQVDEQVASVTRVKQGRLNMQPWRAAANAPWPQVHYLSNGRYDVLITGTGGGCSRWQDTDLTRWRADTTRDNWGTWIYVQDRDNGALWSAGYHPTRSAPQEQEVTFHTHKAEFHRRDHDISLHMEVAVAPEDDVEIRRITLTNHSDRLRRLALTSYGEVVLAPQAIDRRHPAFNKLFIESECLPRQNGLLFRRRPRSAGETPIYLAHLLVLDPAQEVTGSRECDRARFLGRGRTVRSPAALLAGRNGLSGTTGATLDPIMALGQEIDLEPHEVTQLAYVTLATESREKALALAQRYDALPAIQRAFDQARAQGERELRQLGLETPDVEHIQRMLSVLLYPHAALRANPETLAANRKGQSSLWAYAISGDHPILLVRVGSQEEVTLVRELLRAHAYWRNRRIKVDLVILNLQDIGYAQALQDQLHRLIARMDSEAWLNRLGGIFLLRAGQMCKSDRVLLETAARVVLDGEQGRLSEQLADLPQRPTRLPHLVPVLPDSGDVEPTPPLARPTDLQFDNGTGGFDADGQEYVIYLEPDQWTPAPWINVVANPNFGFLVSEAGAGYTWAGNSGENRLTPWCNDPVADEPGEALYLRDEETAQIWSPTPLPAREPAPYLIRHGAGYSIFEHHSHGLEQRVRMFAVPDAPVKVVQLRVENVWSHTRRVTATLYAEWVLGTERSTAQQYIVPDFDAGTHALLARNPYSEDYGECVAFLATDRKTHGLTADRTEFVGEGGNLHHPAALDRVGLAGTVVPGLDPCAALQVHLNLDPGEAQEVVFLLGQGADRAEALGLAERYQDPQEVTAAWDGARKQWNDLLGAVRVRTPDPAMDLLLNRLLLYQALACRVWARSALYQSSGAFGYRDQLQDVMALVHAAPRLAREHILRAACHQFEAGDVLHWWHPPSGQRASPEHRRGRLPRACRGVRTRISDDLLWLPFVTAHYVSVTGDRSILVERVPFRTADPLKPREEERYGQYETAAEEGTLYGHCRRALAQGTTAGPHGLPLMGSGDWNDGMNRVGIEGQGESVWLGWFLYGTLARFAPLCELMDDGDQAAAYLQQARDLLQALEEHAWDGSWYRRAYYDDGTPLGSAQNRECQIDSIAQSWVVLSGAAGASVAPGPAQPVNTPNRATKAMDAVAERLVRTDDRMILLFAPPFDKLRAGSFDESNHDPGYIKGYPPGIRENGGQYTHAALWAVWAFAELGQGDRAMALFRLLNPIHHSDTPQAARRYRVEPYVVAADVYSMPPHTGRGGWTWYTGSAGWMYRLGLEAILGVRREGDALTVDPCIPADWPGYEVTYRDGATVYQIHVENPNGASHGVKQMMIDGKDLPEKEIPLLQDGEEHKIRVLLG